MDMEVKTDGGYKVRYSAHHAGNWKMLEGVFDTYNRAAMIATALENRGFVTQIVNVDFDVTPYE